MNNLDCLFIWEVKNREMESITLMGAELNRRGYKVGYINTWDNLDGLYPDYNAKVRVVSACYNDATYKFFTRYASKFEKVVNLQWEQVLRNGYVEGSGKNSWDMSGQALKTVHICWGEDTKERLKRKYGIEDKYLKVCGYVPLDFYRPRFRGFAESREGLFRAYGLDPKKKTCLFISSFAIAHMPRANRGETGDNFNEIFIRNTLESQEGLLEWIKRASGEREDIQFIYRPHPSEPENRKIEELARERENFYCIAERAIKHWILACDKIYNWTSTSAAEVYASGKQSYIVEPVPTERAVTYPFFEGSDRVDSYGRFLESLDEGEGVKAQPLDEEKFGRYYRQSERPAYRRVCDAIERVMKDPRYVSPVLHPKNTLYNRAVQQLYRNFWNSPVNSRLIKFAKSTKADISFLNVRRNVTLPDKETVKNQKEYYKGRTKANRPGKGETEDLVRRFSRIIKEDLPEV